VSDDPDDFPKILQARGFWPAVLTFIFYLIVLAIAGAIDKGF